MKTSAKFLCRGALALIALLSLSAKPTSAQQIPPSTQPAADAPVTIDFPADGIELRTLADIVTKRLKIPILYDETLLNKRVIVRVPVNVPESALLGVLQSALRMKQMALVDAEQPGWKQIVAAQNLAAVARTTPPGGAPDAGAVTQAFVLKNIDAARAIEAVRPFLTQPGGNMQPVPGQRIIIVSDYPSVVRRIEEMVRLLDAAGPQAEMRFVALRQAEAAELVPLARLLILSRDTYQFGGDSGVYLAPDERSNQVVVVAPTARINDIVKTIEQLDKPIELETRVYRLTNLAPDRLDRLVKNLTGPAAKRTYQATTDRESRSLVVSATPELHVRIAALIKELDVPVTAEQSPIRFYKLKNTKAADVLATISGLQGQQTSQNQQGESLEGTEQPGGGGGGAPTTQPALGMTIVSPPPGGILNTPGAIPSNVPRTLANTQSLTPETMNPYTQGFPRVPTTPSGGPSDQFTPDMTAAGAPSIHAQNATVTADVNTNSIIVIAAPPVQQMYAELIKKLDERRPQVQIECTIVTLDTSNGFTLGVDIGKMGGIRDSKIISFSSFGVSTVDPKTGGLTPVAATGGTFALLNPDIADVVLRALAQNSRSRLVSAPQILVNDNGKGKLQSVSQEPFAEILDTGTTQSRTGLGGQAKAGTTINVEPHISEDDYLQLSYSLELSSFTGRASAGLPPPSQTNNVESTVTIPDGYTIVVGGLSVKNLRTASDSIPILGQIPVLKYLFGNRSSTMQDTTLFVFIKPVILRDDKFNDLKYLSERKVQDAGLPGEYPQSNPIPIR